MFVRTTNFHAIFYKYSDYLLITGGYFSSCFAIHLDRMLGPIGVCSFEAAETDKSLQSGLLIFTLHTFIVLLQVPSTNMPPLWKERIVAGYLVCSKNLPTNQLTLYGCVCSHVYNIIGYKN